MDCDCHPHQTAHTDQRSQLKNMTIVLSMDCCFCESSCNFRFSEASSTSSSSFSRSFLSPHPSALFQPFFYSELSEKWIRIFGNFLLLLCVSVPANNNKKKSSSSSAHETADAETQFIPFSVRWMEASVCALWTSESHRHCLGQYRPDRDRYIAVISVCFSVSELMSSVDDSRVAAQRLLAAGQLLWSACPDLHHEDKPQTHHSLASQA